MANTLDDIERLIRARGLDVERLPDADVLSARLPTKAYKDSAGRRLLEIRIHVDAEHKCLVMDAPWAFDSRKALHKEAMLSCLLGEVGKSPLVRPHYDPQAGEVRLRVDGLLEGDQEAGMSAANVVTMLEALPAFADSVYPQLSSVMRADGPEPTTQAQPAREPSREQRLGDIARRAGGVNRLAALFMMQQRRRNDGEGSGPSMN